MGSAPCSAANVQQRERQVPHEKHTIRCNNSICFGHVSWDQRGWHNMVVELSSIRPWKLSIRRAGSEYVGGRSPRHVEQPLVPCERARRVPIRLWLFSDGRDGHVG